MNNLIPSSFNDLYLIEREAIFFYKGLFKCCPNENVVSNYIKAHLEIPELRNLDNGELGSVHTIVQKRLSFVGIEPWLRSKNLTRRHALTVKLLLLMYLAECGGNGSVFNRQPIALGTSFYLKLLFAGMRSILQLSLGLAQKKVYGIS
jgi:hypothetical protein